ncbi:acyl carrier protein [Lentzea sp. NPDC004789]
MKTIDDFVTLLREEIGLAVSADDVEADLDQVPGWDSIHLLALTMVLEQRTGRTIAMPDLLEAATLGHIYRLAAAA